MLALYVVAEGVSQTGGLDILMNKVLGSASSVFWAQVRMMLPVMVVSRACGGGGFEGALPRACLPACARPQRAALHPPDPPCAPPTPPPPSKQSSAFLNNTPIVALLIPILLSWSRRCNVPAKKLLIPLSFATVFGGTVGCDAHGIACLPCRPVRYAHGSRAARRFAGAPPPPALAQPNPSPPPPPPRPADHADRDVHQPGGLRPAAGDGQEGPDHARVWLLHHHGAPAGAFHFPLRRARQPLCIAPRAGARHNACAHHVPLPAWPPRAQPYGLPYALWGMAYILLFSNWLLPGHDGTGHTDLTSELTVSNRCAPLASVSSPLCVLLCV